MDEEEEKYPPRIEDEPPVEVEEAPFKQDLGRFMGLEDDYWEPLGPEYNTPKYK